MTLEYKCVTMALPNRKDICRKTMNGPKLQIVPKKYVEDSVVISVRLPKDMLEDLDRVAKATGRTRNEIITMSLEFALNNTDIVDD